MIMNCAAVCIMLVSNGNFSNPLGMSPLPRRSPSIFSKARSRIWFVEIVMNRNKFVDVRYKFFPRMIRETVAYNVQALYHDLQWTYTNFEQVLSFKHIQKVKILKNSCHCVGCALVCVVLAVCVSVPQKTLRDLAAKEYAYANIIDRPI